MKAIELYHDLMKSGKLRQNNGLCSEISLCTNTTKEQDLDNVYQYTLDLFKPVPEDVKKFPEAFNRRGFCRGYWGSDIPYGMGDSVNDFGPTRQTILLFIAAIHNEL